MLTYILGIVMFLYYLGLADQLEFQLYKCHLRPVSHIRKFSMTSYHI